jgi:hypothetical protein
MAGARSHSSVESQWPTMLAVRPRSTIQSQAWAWLTHCSLNVYWFDLPPFTQPGIPLPPIAWA